MDSTFVIPNFGFYTGANVPAKIIQASVVFAVKLRIM